MIKPNQNIAKHNEDLYTFLWDWLYHDLIYFGRIGVDYHSWRHNRFEIRVSLWAQAGDGKSDFHLFPFAPIRCTYFNLLYRIYKDLWARIGYRGQGVKLKVCVERTYTIRFIDINVLTMFCFWYRRICLPHDAYLWIDKEVAYQQMLFPQF